ncbi:hypothetical protein N7535_001932 [Penicillium sp. DV-2018c]|nr:hypothetical protein N7461_004824 [Penicillium sp. DV-2018c]KAJ5583312.1 hypothetical protein N7535_001932 [Penicillium sp. DV-2018c]
MSDAYEREQYVPFLCLVASDDHTSLVATFPLMLSLIGSLTLETRQNNALLNSLSSKVSALRSVTIDIHDNARDQDTLDHTNDVFSSFSTNLKGSASRLTRMAKQGDTVAVLKIAGMCIAAGVVLYIILGWIF